MDSQTTNGDVRHGLAGAPDGVVARRRSGLGASTFRHPTRASSLVLIAFDLAALAASVLLFRWTLARGLPFCSLLLIVLLVKGHYRTRMSRDIAGDFQALFSSLAAISFLVIVVIGLAGIVPPRPMTVVSASAGVVMMLLASRWAAYRVLMLSRRRGHFRSRAIVVGTGSVAREIGVEFAKRKEYGVDIVGYVAVDAMSAECSLPGPVIGNVDNITKLSRITNSDRVIVTVGQGENERVLNALRQLPVPGISLYVMPQVFGMGLAVDPMSSDRARGYALVRLAESSHPVIGLRFKRLFDMTIAALALLALSPVMLATALAIKVTSRGPIVFRQVRIGRFGLPFELLKFRSMAVNDDSDSAWTPNASEAQLTSIGRFLRWSSIDELPQIWNIFRGDMSLVGPRPERPVFVDEFSASVPGYVHRHRLPVGLTGLAQVRGLRGDTPMDERVKMDNLYIDQWSFFRDLRLIGQTVWAILRQGAYAEAHVDVEAALAAVEGSEQVVFDLVGREDGGRSRQ
ncbi:MAG: sugar transferase [Actinomycetia bacterium]|nr:sugar transferase [Actinomycetes bacterium]